ncbi:MAG: HAD hydrolase-like protein [Zavarzinella sp.]|nr:HAD hydrolase-like protein [Zavarzinella sp.]
MGTRWVTFDCFGTLVDWHTGFAAALRPIAGDRVGELLTAYHRHEPVLEADRPHRLYKDVLSTAVRRAAADLGLAVTDDQAAALPRAWDALPVFPDVEPALAGLRAESYKLAVLTNCDDDLFSRTQRAFRQPFALVITAEAVKDYKPSVSHFRRFFRVSGVEMADWVHVACSWFHDIEPARAMGLKQIWVDRDRTGQDPGGATACLPDATGLVETVRRVVGM